MSNAINLTKMSFFNLKYLLKQQWLAWAVWVVVPVFNPSFLYMVLGMIVLLTTYQILTYEDMNGIDNLIATLPVKRKEYVISRYLIGIISILIATTITLAICFIASKIRNIDVPLEILIGTGITTVIVAIGIVIPAVLKYGANKGKVISIVVMVIAMAPAFITPEIISNRQLMKSLYKIVDSMGMPLILALFNIIVLATSIGIAIRIYNSKEIK